ncbi:MAG TPA: hypothetical protein PLG75_08695 [Methanoculleus sp.]|nr:hypothetical protein [Methanoculleus sp.]
MPSRARDDALSEVVGFVLILGVIVVALSLYQLYGVPAVGRENEILHMSAVKDRFIDYKISLDSLWLNSINGTNSLEGTTLSTSFDLGTEGGYSQGGGVIFPILAPVSSGGTLSVNRYYDNLTINSTGMASPVMLKPMGEVAFESSNNYWLQQRYYYQMGGLFLSQGEGATARLSPGLSLYTVNASLGSTLEYRLQVNIAAIQVYGYQTTAGQGVARVDTRLREGVSHTSVEGTGATDNVTLTIDAHDAETAALWKQVFLDAADRGGFKNPMASDARPVYIKTEGNRVSLICRPVSGAVPAQKEVGYVDLTLSRASFSVALQQVVTG